MKLSPLPALALALAGVAAGAPKGDAVSFYRHVVPVLQARCQSCHRPGEIGPMPLQSYAQVRPWAKAIKEAVLTRRMPPWFADPGVGKFHNDPSLSPKEIETLAAWADSGAREGDSREAPPPRQFVDGWNIGQPDAVFEMPVEYEVPATGTIEYTDIIIPTGFTEDHWVEKIEIRPGNRAVVHHISAYIREPGVNWLRSYPVGVPFVQNGKGLFGRENRPWETRLSGYAPGSPPESLGPDCGRLFKAGSEIVLEVHYTTNGKPAKDRSRIGLVFSKRPPAKRVVTLSAKNLDLVIPPGAPDHTVDGSLTLRADSELTLLYPHMHVRGKAMEMRAVYPTGEKEVLLRVPRYDFNWQLRYEPVTRKLLPKGTRIEATGVFDNSPNNRYNPDPKKTVRWGDQSWEEMMVGFVELAFDAKLDIQQLVFEDKRPN
jgi:mono/diheme cytochrome c family protein